MDRAKQNGEGGKNSGKPMHGWRSVRVRKRSRARESGVSQMGVRQAEAPFRRSRRTYSRPGYREPRQYQPDGPGKGDLLVYFSFTGRTAIEIESSLAPLTCSTNDPSDSSNLRVLRMPSQSVAPLVALGFRNCPFCTTSTQPPDDRLMV